MYVCMYVCVGWYLHVDVCKVGWRYQIICLPLGVGVTSDPELPKVSTGNTVWTLEEQCVLLLAQLSFCFFLSIFIPSSTGEEVRIIFNIFNALSVCHKCLLTSLFSYSSFDILGL